MKFYSNWQFSNPCITLSLCIFLFFSSSNIALSQTYTLEQLKDIQKTLLMELDARYSAESRKLYGRADGSIDTSSNGYQEMAKRYNAESELIKKKVLKMDPRQQQWELDAKNHNLTQTGSDPKNVKADGDFAGSTKDVSSYRDGLRAKGHEVIDYGYKVWDVTTDQTIWRPDGGADLVKNIREADLEVIKQMYKKTGRKVPDGLMPGTADANVIKDAKLIDTDAFSTTGGQHKAGLKTVPGDPLGWQLDNSMKLQQAILDGDLKTIGKSVVKMSDKRLQLSDSTFFDQAEGLKAYKNLHETGIVDIGDSPEIKQKKVDDWIVKAKKYAQESIDFGRKQSQITQQTREEIARQVERTDPELAERIRERNRLSNESNRLVEQQNRIMEGKALESDGKVSAADHLENPDIKKVTTDAGTTKTMTEVEAKKIIVKKLGDVGKKVLKMTGDFMLLMDILNTGKTLEDLYEGKISAAEAVEVTIDRFSGGAISTPKLLLIKHTDYLDSLRLTMQALETDNESRVTGIGIELRSNGVSRDEAQKIMAAMRQGNEQPLQMKVRKLAQAGKTVKVPERITIDLNDLPTSDDNPWQRAVMVKDGIVKEVSRAYTYVYDAIVNGSMTKEELWETLDDITGKIKQANDYTGELIGKKTYQFYESVVGLYEDEATIELFKQQYENLKFENWSQWQDAVREEKIANDVVFLQKQADKEWAMDMKMKLFKQGASPRKADYAVSQWIQGNKKPMQDLKGELRLQGRDVHIRLLVSMDGVQTTNLIRNGVIHLKQGSIDRSAKLTQSGLYKFQDVEPGTYSLSIQANGYKTESGSSTLLVNLTIPSAEANRKQTPISKIFYMVSEPVDVTLAVVDDRGNAVASADIALHGSHWRSGNLRPVDKSGIVIFNAVPPGAYEVSVVAPGYHSSTVNSQIRITPADIRSGLVKRITLTPVFSTVMIDVVDAFTVPITGAKIMFGEHVGLTDAQGHITFTPVRPSGGLDPYKVAVSKEGFTPIITILEVSPAEEGEEFFLEVTLQGGLMLSVGVVDVESGKNLSGATVQLSYNEENMAAISDNNGVAQFFGIAPAFVYISAALPGYQLVSVVEKDLHFAVAGEEQTAEIKLSEGMNITAYVKDEKGELLASGYVSMDNGPFYEAPTGSKEFTPVKEGIHEFKARAKQFAETSVFYNAKPKDKSSDKVSLQLIPGATLMVEVRNERGDLLRKVPTKITLLKNGEEMETVPGPLKLFANLGPGTYSARANAKEYTIGLSPQLHYNGTPPAFHDTLKVMLLPEIQMSTIFVAVNARDDQGNPVLAAAKIEVNGPFGSITENDLIGNFPDLIPGRYTVTASVKGFGSKTQTVTISPDQPGKIHSLSFTLSANEEIKIPPDNQKIKPPVGIVVFDMQGCLNGCGDVNDDCISSCIIRKYKYCEVLCRGPGKNGECYRNCVNRTDVSTGDEYTPPPAGETRRECSWTPSGYCGP